MEITDADAIPSRDKTYFIYYGMLMHQQNMLLDQVRTSIYHDAIVGNKTDFAGKVVLDIGAGTGILSFFAAKAGARKVYAVEASDMYIHAQTLVRSNRLEHVIKVIHGKIEDITLPEQVDVIISEPMGVFLVHERMMESFIRGRDRFLKPALSNGTFLPNQMFPSAGTVFLAPFTDMSLYSDVVTKISFWNTKDFYGVNLQGLLEDAAMSQFAQVVVGPIDPKTLLSQPISHTFPFHSMSVSEFENFHIPFRFIVEATSIIHGLAGWFDVAFCGLTSPRQLSTSPHCETTHWYQARFMLQQPIAVNKGQVIEGKMSLRGNDQRSHDVTLMMRLGDEISLKQEFRLQDQQYWNLAGVNTNLSKENLGIYDEFFNGK